MSKEKSIERLIEAALAIEADEARKAGALGFMARALTQATLPHRKVDGNEFTRRNGHFTLTMLAPSKVGLPYGSIPRLLMCWLTTEAIRQKSREIELGDSLSGFMRELGLVPTGGRWGSVTRLKEQTRRLFSSTVSCSYSDAETAAEIGFRFADKSMLWWDAKDPSQAALWRSSVTLSAAFYEEISQNPVPIDLRALHALKQSPMALDAYVWLTYRMSYLKRSTTIPWAALAAQFGSDYARVVDFKTAFSEHLQSVLTVYPEARVEASKEGLTLRPSPSHVLPSKG